MGDIRILNRVGSQYNHSGEQGTLRALLHAICVFGETIDDVRLFQSREVTQTYASLLARKRSLLTLIAAVRVQSAQVGS